MASIINEPSRTFGEYLLLPNLTTRDCIVDNEVPRLAGLKREKNRN